MKKYLLIATLLCSCYLQTFCQQDKEVNILKSDSLKKLLPTLNGTELIDCMVSICEHYFDVWPGGRFNDSILYYGNKVFDEAKAENYKRGMALGLLILAPLATDSVKEKNVNEAIRMGEEIDDDIVLGWGYRAKNSLIEGYKQTADCYKKSIDHFNKAGNTLREAQQSNWLSEEYSSAGETETAFDYTKKSIDLLKNTSKEFPNAYDDAMCSAFEDMSFLYSSAGDYENAMNYARMANKFSKTDKTRNTNLGGYNIDISDIFFQMGQYDSAMLYWNLARNGPNWNSIWRGGQVFAYNSLANIYIGEKEYNKAIEILTINNMYFDSLRNHGTGNFSHTGQYGRMGTSLLLGKAYDEKKSHKAALQFAKEGFRIAQGLNSRQEMMQGYQLLSSVYHHLGKNDSAYEYLLKYYAIKDSIQNKQFLLRIYNSKKDAEVGKQQSQLLLLDKDNKLKTEQLKQQAQQRNFLLILLSAFALAGIFIYRSIYLKRKNERLLLKNELTVELLESEKKYAELKRQASDLQMQALRAQMNPHFIFNSLSSINWYILQNDKDTASDYLTRFSRLMRMVLNSQKPMIPLEDELKMLQLYLDLERLRFDNAFDYSITFTNAAEAGTVSIPPMLLQPFCENAIWHGFMNKDGQGHININIRTEGNLLECVIADNGIGRHQAAALKIKSAKKEKSLGLEITRERLALFSEENNAAANFAIEDFTDENGICTGTRVILKITYKKLIEEAA